MTKFRSLAELPNIQKDDQVARFLRTATDRQVAALVVKRASRLLKGRTAPVIHNLDSRFERWFRWNASGINPELTDALRAAYAAGANYGYQIGKSEGRESRAAGRALVCRNCARQYRVRAARGLCRPCWNDPEVRARHPVGQRFGGSRKGASS